MTIIHALSFSVATGEIVGFLGPNGAGKTTTMRMIAGVTAATSGRVTVAGYDMATQNTDAARQSGYLLEHPPLYDTLGVSAYVRFGAKGEGGGGGALRADAYRWTMPLRLHAVCWSED